MVFVRNTHVVVPDMQKLLLTSSTLAIIYSNNDTIRDVLDDKQFVEASK